MLAKFDQQLGDKVEDILRTMLREQVVTLLVSINPNQSKFTLNLETATTRGGLQMRTKNRMICRIEQVVTLLYKL